MRYMLIDQTGLCPSFYAEDIQGPLIDAEGKRNPAYPDGVVPISDEVWLDFLSNQGRRKWNPGTETFDPYDPPAPPPPAPQVSGDAIVSLLTNAQAAQVAKDAIRIALRDDVPVTNPKLVRIAKALGKDPGDLWNLASSQ